MTDKPLVSPLHARHEALGATIGQEAGWDVPLSYGNVIEEVRALRGRAGVFDISHHGRIRIRGQGALELLERVCCGNVARQEDDTCLQAVLCNQAGGILDCLWLARAEDFWLLTTSPEGRGKVLEHLRQQAAGLEVKIDDQTERTAMLEVCGRQAASLLDAMLPNIRPSQYPSGAVMVGSMLVARYVAMRVGGCNEWSLQVVLHSMLAGQAWQYVTKRAGNGGIPPAGLAARDVLRIESGLPRYGCELNETIDPFLAGLGGAVDFGHDFIGKAVLEGLRARPPARRPAGLALLPKGQPQQAAIPRQGAAVHAPDGEEVGTVTSAAYSPTLGQAIALAYVSPQAAAEGAELAVDGPGQPIPATVVALPFCRPA